MTNQDQVLVAMLQCSVAIQIINNRQIFERENTFIPLSLHSVTTACFSCMEIFCLFYLPIFIMPPPQQRNP